MAETSTRYIYKLKIDESFFEDGSGAAAAILRNSRGEDVSGISELIDTTISPQAAEAIALMSGLKPVDRLGCRNVQIESDCLELVQACNGDSEISSPHSAIRADCFLLAHNIPGINFKHCPREANEVAHFLARRCYDSKICEDWVDVTPAFLLPLVLHDVTLSQIK